jgi:hypothetical protein
MFTRIFGRLSAWQNWIFQRPNAVGDKGALKVYGKGEKVAVRHEPGLIQLLCRRFPGGACGNRTGVHR